VAAIYRQCWQVEMFLKSINQNPRIKNLTGTPANALKIAIWTALIGLLMVRVLELPAQIVH
jgi:IS4 transposase